MTTKLRTKGAIAWAGAWGLVLALFAGQALALGLGRIEVKSQRNQPLLAEIQVISSDPAELDQLQARLASPDTFARIGLEPPEGVVSGLQFTVALDARGNPVIRVTSREPVQESLLTFLVEVDWGQGRLVREYSALVDAPNTVSAPAQPPVQAPVVAPANTIVRPAGTPVAETGAGPAVAELDREPEQAAVPAEAPAEPEGPDPDAVAASPAPAAAAPAPASAPAPPAPDAQASPTEYGPVQAGETLGEIAQVLVADGLTREQAIVALYRANPQAFISDNLNLIRRGAVLRIPQGEQRNQHSVAEARALVREHVAQWRDMRQPAAQPEAVAEGAAPQPGAGDAAVTAGATPRVAAARLEIVPPSSGSGQQAGTRSGTVAGGEGEMLRQELQQELLQNKETLAARDAEVAELKARVADLERLQAQQQQLISLKDSDLAAAQARLAEGNAQAAPAAASTATTQADGTVPPAEQAGSGLPWIWIGVVLLATGLLVAWLMKRRKPAPTSPFDRAALAAATPKAGGREGPSVAQGEVAAAGEGELPEGAAPSWNAPARGIVQGAPPVWHTEPEPEPEFQAQPSAPRSEAPPAPALPDGASVAPLNPAPAGVDRIELARAYLDLGDTETARSLLQEVVEGGDAGAREEASQLLRGIA